MEGGDTIFHLSSHLVGHKEDVRCLLTTDSEGAYIVTGSRDRTIKVWKQQPDPECVCDLSGHGDYVTALCVGPRDGCLISGSRDATVRVWLADEGLMCREEGQVVLTGHEYQVTGLASYKEGDIIVSTSLDKSTRVWKMNGDYSSGTCLHVMQEHDGPVLCAAKVSESALVTGSGDCTLRFWSIDKSGNIACTSVLSGHTDTVRSVASLPGIGIVSGSHDMTLKVWTLDGDCVQTFEGHGALIYSVAVNSDSSLIASGSEDNTVRIWNLSGECVQVIQHPGCVWAVSFLPNGDLVTACSDGIGRIWSRDSSRIASEEVQAMYEAQVEAYTAKPEQQEDGQGKMKMYDSSALQQPGQYDGHTIVVDEGSCGMVYAWNQSAGDWEKVGEVMTDGAAADTGSQWDFEFDVDIADDQPKLKLCANAGEDAYTVADRFIAEHNLPTSYKEQIAQFLVTNTSGKVNIHMDTSGSYVDPFTGSNAYVPTSNAAPAPPSFAGGANVDPFTGSAPGQISRFPVKEYVLFTSPLSASARKKLKEFSDDIAKKDETLAIQEDDWAAIDALLDPATQGPMPGVIDKILCWPSDTVFPLLDIFRALLSNDKGRAMMMTYLQSIKVHPESGSCGAVIEKILKDPENNAGKIAALRVLVNMFHTDTTPIVLENLDHLVRLVSLCRDSEVKGIQNAYTAFVLNTAVLLAKMLAPNADSISTVANEAAQYVGKHKDSPNATALMQALLAIGTLRRESLLKRSDVLHLIGSDVFTSISARAGEEASIAIELQKM
ncbi:hypothetical protein M9435_001354 [Picochlorum sp. BPE23]|nr:hypothetical protein M9435_001354 [Picochlorum sp. BPE23]